jgi:hypothetical protein
MHLALDLKWYVVSKVYHSSQPTPLQGPPSNVVSITIDLHMVIIYVHVGKNLVKDVLLDGGSSVNITIKTHYDGLFWMSQW